MELLVWRVPTPGYAEAVIPEGVIKWGASGGCIGNWQEVLSHDDPLGYQVVLDEVVARPVIEVSPREVLLRSANRNTHLARLARFRPDELPTPSDPGRLCWSKILHLRQYSALTCQYLASCLVTVIDAPPLADLPSLGRAVARARHAADLTLEGLAERSGVSRRMLVEVEQGRVNCTVGVLHAIAHAVSIPMGRLAEAACGHKVQED